MIITVFLLCLESLDIIIYFLFKDNECCDKSTELPRDDQRDSSRTYKRFSPAALWANTKVCKPFSDPTFRFLILCMLLNRL